MLVWGKETVFISENSELCLGEMDWSRFLKRPTLLNVSIVFVKHTLKLRKCKNISDNKNTFRDVP